MWCFDSQSIVGGPVAHPTQSYGENKKSSTQDFIDFAMKAYY